MQIYFGERKQNETFDEEYLKECFLNEGKFYDFRLHLNTDQILLEDTCNRLFPIGLEDFVQFSEAMLIASHYVSPVVNALPMMDKINSDEVRTV